MITCKGFGAKDGNSVLGPMTFERRDLKANDVLIDIDYCGVCHSDIHQVRNEWGGSSFPMVPGHEIVGRIVKVGASVNKFKVGDLAGVGCLVDSCRNCESCREGLEQYCDVRPVWTYNSIENDGVSPTQGGYSNQIVCDQAYTLKISPKLNLAAAAPLLCAGITTYSPLKHWKIKPGQKVGIVGLGGLGHMGVKISKAFGAKTVVFTTSISKKSDARRLGADEVVLSKNPEEMLAHHRSFDFILDTVSAPHDVGAYLGLLKRDASMVLVGIPDKPMEIPAFHFIAGRKRLSGSGIGGIAETQEMLDFCAEHQIVSDIELIPVQKINEAYERVIRGEVKYRFVLDIKGSL